MIVLTLDDSRTKLALHFEYRQDLVDLVKRMPGRVWRRPYWLLPLTTEQVAMVEQAFQPFGRVVKDQLLTDFLAGKRQQAQEVLAWRQQGAGLLPLPQTKFVTQPFQHQLTALALCQRREAFALFMEMGTGKTKVMVDLLGNAASSLPALVVAPVSVLYNWQREAGKHQPHVQVAVCHGTKAQRFLSMAKVASGAAQVLTINYEAVWRYEDELKRIGWGTIILDEATRIKHRATSQAKAVMRLGLLAKRRYILTGTPSPNSPLELFNQIRFLDPTVLGSSWYAFRDRYAVMGGYGGYQVLGWKNLPELSQKLAGISFRCLKKDCLDLPEKTYKEYRLDMDVEQRRIYKELAEQLVTEVQGTDIIATVVLAKLTKLRQLALGFVYKPDGSPARLAANPKLDQLEAILPDLAKAHKVVVWCSFREELKLIEELCKKLGLWSVLLDGTVDAKGREAAVKAFQENPKVRVFVGQQHAGGIGIDLFAADYCVFFSNDYSYEVRAQAEDRLHRIGQKNAVTYVDLIMKGTIESTIKRMLVSKANLAAQVTPGSLEGLVFDETL